MRSTLRWKWLLITLVVVACIVGVTGFPKNGEQLTANLNKNIRLGLDLKGGSHIVLQIQVQDAFKSTADTAIENLQDALRKENIAATIERNDPTTFDTAETIQITVKGVPVDRTNDFRRIVSDTVGTDWILSSDSSSDYHLNIKKEAAVRLTQDTLKQSIQTMERKVNGMGVAEASVQARGGSAGDTELLVQLPGVDDPARAKSILQTSAQLELAEVKDQQPYPSPDAIRAAHNGILPVNTRIVRGSARAGGGMAENYWLLSRTPVVTGRDLRNARAQQGDMPGRWETAFTLTQDAAKKFERYTSANINNRLAIVLDNTVISAPTIQATISDNGTITGAASIEEAQDLALNLRAGALPAGVKVIEERTVGPSLGADSIRKGVMSGIVGLALVIVLMLLIYRGAGINSVIGVIFNTIITISFLSYIDATWTLPGIAGLILSIGMALDSNILIFERIKEELRGGKAPAAAIAAGFARALTIIIDTHVTTVVASAFLFMFGTGPVKGFAVTLVIGLMANLFTAVFVSRAIFDWEIDRNPRRTTVSLGHDLLHGTNINFLSKRHIVLTASIIAMIAGFSSVVVRGDKLLGLDFRGGTMIYARFDPMPSTDEIRSALQSKLGEVSVQEDRRNKEFIIGTELADEAKLDQTRQGVQQVLREKYANTGDKLDLNNATQSALQDRLRTAALGLDDNQLKALVGRILNYRDTEKSGILKSIDELSGVPGVDAKVMAALKQDCALGTYNLRSVDIVGPRAGAELRNRAVLATLCALGGMLVYIGFRFHWVSGVAAIIATVHDVAITLGLFVLTGRQIDLTIIAALLTLIGYSTNDTIVVFDRIRENLRNKRRVSFLQLVNDSVNQTLSRTILTSSTTFLACLSLFVLGGPVLNNIAFALLVGIVVGTYSSVFVAGALVVVWEEYREKRAAAARTGRPATVKS